MDSKANFVIFETYTSYSCPKCGNKLCEDEIQDNRCYACGELITI